MNTVHLQRGQPAPLRTQPMLQYYILHCFEHCHLLHVNIRL